MVREIYSLRETLTKNFEVNSTNVTESSERTNTRTNIRTDKRQGENYIPRGINAGGIKTTEANLTKLHRKIEHNEKVCSAQELGFYAQGQGHNQVRGRIVSKIVLLINYCSKFDKTSQKDRT